jgi:hypothetical protein
VRRGLCRFHATPALGVYVAFDARDQLDASADEPLDTSASADEPLDTDDVRHRQD